MNFSDIPYLRLQNQRISHNLNSPEEVVEWLGAVQAQDYLGSLFAIGLRTKNSKELDIEKAIIERKIIRTWPMRGTLHFISAKDAKWMLNLMAAKVLKGKGYREKQLELTKQDFTKAKNLFIKALQGGKSLTRNAMYEVLDRGGISSKNQRGLHILGHMAEEALICFGPREGKQPTFVLLEEWENNQKKLSYEESLGEITLRYFKSHSLATIQDFMWWSGLSAKEINIGLEINKSKLISEKIDNKTYWLERSTKLPNKDNSLYLLPPFDEYIVSYKDREAVLNKLHKNHINPGSNGMLSAIIVLNGQIVGTWKRELKKDTVIFKPFLFTPLRKQDYILLEEKAKEYAKFLSLSVTIQL